MARHKYSKEEVEQWDKDHQGIFYFNKDDTNLIVRRRLSFGWTLNFAHPTAWIITSAVVALIIALIIVVKVIL
jgi:uncharacterized membrane protein